MRWRTRNSLLMCRRLLGLNKELPTKTECVFVCRNTTAIYAFGANNHHFWREKNPGDHRTWTILLSWSNPGRYVALYNETIFPNSTMNMSIFDNKIPVDEEFTPESQYTATNNAVV